MLTNVPEVKLGLIAVSRDCFIISLSERRRAAVVYGRTNREFVQLWRTTYAHYNTDNGRIL